MVDVPLDSGLRVGCAHREDGFCGLHPGASESPGTNLVDIRVHRQGNLGLGPDVVEMDPHNERGSDHILYHLPPLQFVCIQVFLGSGTL